jgi:hypothetical protein
MFDVEKYLKKALLKLKLNYGLPKSGFIAGGSIANLTWEMVSGHKAVVNDIDIFIVDNSNEDKIYQFERKELEYFETYGQISYTTKVKDSYKIHESSNDGIFNRITYSSKNTSPQIIIDSFDINSVMVGYSVDEDKFYYRPEFVEFLKTGVLKVVNLHTPAHTAIRLIKKSNELNAKVDELEFKILSHCVKNKLHFSDIDRYRFLQRYADMFEKYKSFLLRYFELKRDAEIEEYLKESKKVETPVYYIEPISEFNFGEFKHSMASDFLFYVRNVFIKGDEKLFNIWNNLHFYFKDINYVNGDEKDEDIKYLTKLSNLYPNIINNLKGMNFAEQINIVRNVMQKITNYYDYDTAISVLENIKLSRNTKFDEDSCLIIGLSVRTKVRRNDNKPHLPF